MKNTAAIKELVAVSGEDGVTAQLVPENERMQFLPTVFGPRLMMRGENWVYGYMSRLCEKYTGAYWEFYRLSNGGFYLAPRIAGPMLLKHADNFFEGEMSADAAGIVATLFAVNGLCWDFPDEEHLAKAYSALLEFAYQHAEVANICACTN
jgi:hypothetical protein